MSHVSVDSAADAWWRGYSAHWHGQPRPADPEAASGWDAREVGMVRPYLPAVAAQRAPVIRTMLGCLLLVWGAGHIVDRTARGFAAHQSGEIHGYALDAPAPTPEAHP